VATPGVDAQEVEGVADGMVATAKGALAVLDVMDFGEKEE
jgi:hypothetical protein